MNCTLALIMVENIGAGIERYMSLLTARQKVVAGNIANADTPGYKTKDVNFRAALADQMGNSEPSVIEVSGLKTKNDGNNVNIDREARMLSENALRFNIATNLARGEIRLVKNAIEEGKSS